MNYSMSKERFIEIIENIKKQKDFDYSFSKDMQKYFVDSFMIHYNNELYEETIIKMLEDIFDDVQNMWISYYIYECEFGIRHNVIWYEKLEIPFKTAEDLYNVLVNKDLK